MINFYRDSNGVTVYFGGGRSETVIVNSDIELKLSDAMTFGEEKIVKVQQKRSKTVVTGYQSDAGGAITTTEFEDRKNAIANDKTISPVEMEIRLEVLQRTWKKATQEVEEMVDVPFVILPLQTSDDYRLLPVRCSRESDKPVYFTLRGRQEWLFPHIVERLKAFGMTRLTDRWRSEKKTYSLDVDGLRIEGNEIFSNEEKQEIFQHPFTGTVEECQKRINDILDLVEEKINLWWKVKQRTDGYTIADILAMLKQLHTKVTHLDVKKNDASDKAGLIRMIEEQQRKMVEYAKAVPNPTPEQIAYESSTS